MTLEDAKECTKQLEKINLDIWRSSGAKTLELRAQFKAIMRSIYDNGFTVRKWKSYNDALGYKVPRYSIQNKDTGIVNIVNNEYKNGYNVRDCTTRCISLCTGEDYMTIQKEQFANANRMKADGYNVTWRTMSVWSKSLLSRGFCRIDLPRNVSRKVFLRLFNNSGIDSGIIATRSSGHVAAIDMKSKKILDTWNSSGGRIRTIFVPTAMKDIWTRKINEILGRTMNKS